MEDRLQNTDIHTIRLSLGLLGFAMLLSSFQVPAVSMCPFEAMASQNGRYVIAIVDETHVVIWDMERLRGGWQPVQVHGFQAPIALRPDRNIAVSANGKRLAYEDANANEIIVCDMKSGFPCRGALSLPDKANLRALEWSPDGSRLLVVTRLRKNGMLHLLSLNEVGEDRKAISREWLVDVPIVDWKLKRLAVGHSKTLTIYDLETTSPIRKVKTLGYPKPLSFTGDGDNIVVQEEGVLRVYHIHPDAVPGVVHLRAEASDYDLVKGMSGTLWYAKPIDGDNKQNWDLVPATEAGELNRDRKLPLQTHRKVANILWVDARSQYVLVHTFINCQHNTRLINLRTRLVEFELYNSKVNYRSKDFTLPHLLPWLGADPGYRVVPLPLHIPAAMLQYAAIATVVRDRYDAIWFGLLTALEPFALSTEGYSELLELSGILIQLRRAEYFLKSGQSSDAVIISDAAWGQLERMMPVLENVPALDRRNPALISLVAAYLPVIRNDILLVRAQSAIALRQWKIAAVSLNQILQTNPHDWRAHAGQLYLNLNSTEEVFVPLLREAQDTLRLESWTSELKWGFPPQFFHEPTLQDLRAESQSEVH